MPPYGDMFRIGEVLLIYFRNEPAFFARVENIAADRKKGWWQITLLLLSLPLKTVTWILDNDQVRGADFTMGGEPFRIERVVAPEPDTVETKAPEMPPKEQQEKRDDDDGARIVSMFDDDE